MTIAMMALVWRCPDLSPTERMVMLALADQAQDNGEVSIPSELTEGKAPETRLLARKCFLTERGFRKILGRLCEMQPPLVFKESGVGGRGNTADFFLNVERLVELARPVGRPARVLRNGTVVRGDAVAEVEKPGTAFRVSGENPEQETLNNPERGSGFGAKTMNGVQGFEGPIENNTKPYQGGYHGKGPEPSLSDSGNDCLLPRDPECPARGFGAEDWRLACECAGLIEGARIPGPLKGRGEQGRAIALCYLVEEWASQGKETWAVILPTVRAMVVSPDEVLRRITTDLRRYPDGFLPGNGDKPARKGESFSRIEQAARRLTAMARGRGKGGFSRPGADLFAGGAGG